MKNIKAILLFLVTNIVIVLMLNIVVYLISQYLGVDIFASRGDWMGIVIFALIFGFGGAFINLQISKWMAKKAYHIRMLSNTAHGKEKVIYDLVHDLARQHHIKAPEVGVYDAPDANAFATGPSKDNSLLAVSTGLLQEMTEEEIKGVVGHEFAHIINGDMVTMTLLQGVINTFVIFLARVLAFAIDIAMKKRDDEEGGLGTLGYFLVVNILDILLGFVGMIVLMGYSRHREYRADAGSAALVGKTAMIQALQKLKHIGLAKKATHDEFSMLKISGGKDILHLLSSHPSLEDRINRLKQMN